MVPGSCVNLRRWGLKLGELAKQNGILNRRVNLPRWGLKPFAQDIFVGVFLCKFTPLGFETAFWQFVFLCRPCVNLPRWGLKPGADAMFNSRQTCKFTPLGFETTEYP